MGPGILKVEEMNRLAVISLLFTAELLEDTHMELWERETEKLKQLKQGSLMPCIRFFHILSVHANPTFSSWPWIPY